MDELESMVVNTEEARINVRRGGSGPPVLLLHGFPQTMLVWRDIAPLLTGDFTVVCADLRGYGGSSCRARRLPRGARSSIIDRQTGAARRAANRHRVGSRGRPD